MRRLLAAPLMRRAAWAMATPLLLPVLVPLTVLDWVHPLRLPAPFDGPAT